MNNGPLGGPTNRGLGGAGGLHGRSQRAPGLATHDDPHRSTVLQHAAQAAHHLATAMGSIGTNSAIGGLLGRESFSAGVAFGMLKNLAVGVHQLGDLLKVRDGRVRRISAKRQLPEAVRAVDDVRPMGASANVTMMSLAHFWPGFDRAAKDAREQRDALFQLVAYQFGQLGSPGLSLACQPLGPIHGSNLGAAVSCRVVNACCHRAPDGEEIGTQVGATLIGGNRV